MQKALVVFFTTSCFNLMVYTLARIYLKKSGNDQIHNPQPSLSDDNYDASGEEIIQKAPGLTLRTRIIENRSVIRSARENIFLDNDIEEEVDATFEAKRRTLIEGDRLAKRKDKELRVVFVIVYTFDC